MPREFKYFYRIGAYVSILMFLESVTCKNEENKENSCQVGHIELVNDAGLMEMGSYPYMHVVAGSGSFEEKIKRLARHILLNLPMIDHDLFTIGLAKEKLKSLNNKKRRMINETVAYVTLHCTFFHYVPKFNECPDAENWQCCVEAVLDFKCPDAIRSLTTSLLEKDFGLNIDIPAGSLVPRLPLRLNYILWVEDLLKQNQICNDNVTGIDIVLKVDENTALKGVVDRKLFDDQIFDFCMCNPPFYNCGSSASVSTSDHETVVENEVSIDIEDETVCNAPSRQPQNNSRSMNRPNPHSVTVAKTGEVFAEGGELAFVSRIIDDSDPYEGHPVLGVSKWGAWAFGPVLEMKR
uniref:Uncharacterized protein n=1 Tax=Romanomermis culicivorax TaxID=13658 RepID=A0A915JBF3_ROMCU